ncbi:MAG: molecular chaperone DnaJ [Gracilibacteraceae bacterium]|jgi:molecular chaperone DnaJ|nr:molecular chaperone DnaJ [Gracilibacteraceae bacterium]
MKRDYYEVLGVAKTSGMDEIKKAYRTIARENHPDVNPGNKQAEERFKEATEAYAVLSDEEKRDKYDRFGHAGVDPSGQGFGGMGMDFGDLGDILGMFFGGGGVRRTGPARGADLRYDLTITLEDAAFGSEKVIEVPAAETCSECHGSGAAPGTSPEKCSQCNGTGTIRSVQRTPLGQMATTRSCPACGGTGSRIAHPCAKCSGRGKVRALKEIKVTVPKGSEHGLNLRYSGRGEAGDRGGENGDLYVVLNIKAHEFFERRGNDVYCEVPISFVQAALGDDIEVNTLHGPVKLRIPEGTQTSRIFRIRDKGVPYRRGNSNGDQHVRVVVVTPTKLSEHQKNLLREFGDLPNGGPPAQQEGKKSFWKKLKESIQDS